MRPADFDDRLPGARAPVTRSPDGASPDRGRSGGDGAGSGSGAEGFGPAVEDVAEPGSSDLEGSLPDADGIEIRPLVTLEEFRACVALQRATWGDDFTEIVPLALLKVCQRIGGVTAGAFGPDGELLGFVFGMTGIDDHGDLVHWSDMLAVRPGHRNRGLGRRLKEYQRQRVRARGVRSILWTFDPLVARNAHLNLNRLGARIVDYVPDMYGETDSPLHRGTGTDRLIVSWPLDDDPEAGRGPGSGDDFGPGPDAAPGRDAPDAVPVVNPWPESGASGPRLDDLPSDAPLVAIQIPRDILAIQQASLEEASSWRRSTRAAFLALGERGYGVVGFERTERGPCRYLLAPAAARPGDASAALAPPDDASPPPALRRSTSPSPGPGGPATLPPTSRPPASSNGEPTS